MNEIHEKVKSFCQSIQSAEMDKENTAVIILSLDSKDMPEGDNRTTAFVQGKTDKLIELLCCTLLQEPKFKALLGEAVKVNLIQSFLNREKETSDDMPAKGEPDPADVAAN